MKRKLWVPLLLAVLLIAGGLWYTRPMDFKQLCPMLDREDPCPLSGTYTLRRTHPNGKVDSLPKAMVLQKGDPLAAELLQILDSYTYCRSLTSLLPRFDTGFIDIQSPNVWLINTHTAKGDALLLYPNSSKLIVECGETGFYCSAKANQPEALEQAIYNFLMEHSV